MMTPENHSRLIDELVRDECIDGKPALKPYRDSVRNEKYPRGILTIGIGRNLEDTGISTGEAYYLASNDVEAKTADLDEHLPWWRGLDDARQRVLINMCFNMGIHRLLKFKNMLAALRRGDLVEAAKEMENSDWYGQVGPRAKRMMDLMVNGDPE
jgi:lysozyme